MSELKKSDNGRRDFFKKLSAGLIGAAFISYMPFKFLRKNKPNKKLTVRIHPSAVKRNKV